jgi:hypothetical protein
VLAAHALSGVERGAALARWAEHVAGAEGSLWRAAGLLVAAGCCREALQVSGARLAGVSDGWSCAVV